MGTYFALELKRALRDPSALMFTIGIPAFMYYIFGVSMEWGAYDIGNGNVSMYVMINMAAYGAVTATTSVGGLAAVERMQGWGRQLGLTPMPDSRFVITKALVGTAVAALPIALIYLIGYFTDAQAIWWVWPASAGLVLLGAMLFSLYGLMVGLLVPVRECRRDRVRHGGDLRIPRQRLHAAEWGDADLLQVHAAVRPGRARPASADRGQ